MKFGVCVPNYGPSSSAEGISAVAVEADHLGYDSVWTTDHILMSKNSGTPYERVFDSIGTLAYIAPLTSKVRLGISSLIIAMRNPAVVAKQLATIDAFSGGRTLLAIGVGWNEKEFRSVGSDFRNRGKRVDESIELLRTLWQGGENFQGRYLSQRFTDVVFDPKPRSKNLEIWIGGVSEPAMRRAINLGDAWHPNVVPMEAFSELVSRFRRLSPEAQVKPISVRIAIDLHAQEPEYIGAQGERRLKLTGDMDANSKIISRLEELGVAYAVLVPSPEGRTSTEDQLQCIQEFADGFLGP